MFERFTDRARRAVVLAQDEARRLGHDHIDTEHLLVGVVEQSTEGEISEGRPLRKVLVDRGAVPDRVRTRVEEISGHGFGTPPGHIPFTPQAKRVLELSLHEALQLGHGHIGAEHILLALIREGEGTAAALLVEFGLTAETVRAAFERSTEDANPKAPGGAGDIRRVPELQIRVENRAQGSGRSVGSNTRQHRNSRKPSGVM